MTDFTPQSTDRANDNTNPNVTNVVLEGQATLVSLGSNSYSVTVTFPLDSQYANLEIEAWVRVQTSGGLNPVRHYKMPFHIPTNATTTLYSGWILIGEPQRTGTYDVVFNLFTTVTLLTDSIIYYRLVTNKIASGGLTFT